MLSNNTRDLIRAWIKNLNVIDQLHDSLLEDGYPNMAEHVMLDSCQFRGSCFVGECLEDGVSPDEQERYCDRINEKIKLRNDEYLQ